MAELKTKPNNTKIEEFLDTIKDENQKKDAKKILEIMKKGSGFKPKMWGSSIIGFGDTEYKTADGKSHKWFKIGFSPRKANLSLYILNYYSKNNNGENELLSKLGKYKRGKSCLYINSLEDIDLEILNELINNSVK